MPPAGCADDLISDVIGGCDPLSFGFSAQQELASTDPDSFSNLATGLSGSLTVSTAAAAKGPAADAAPKGAPGGAAGCSPRTGSGTLPTLQERRAEQHDGSPDGPAAQLRRFQESYLWSVLSYGANFDVHEVRRSAAAQQPRCSHTRDVLVARLACRRRSSASGASPHGLPVLSAVPAVQVVDTDERIGAIHYHSERFDWKAESELRGLGQALAKPAARRQCRADSGGGVGVAGRLSWVHAPEARLAFAAGVHPNHHNTCCKRALAPSKFPRPPHPTPPSCRRVQVPAGLHRHDQLVRARLQRRGQRNRPVRGHLLHVSSPHGSPPPLHHG